MSDFHTTGAATIKSPAPLVRNLFEAEGRISLSVRSKPALKPRKIIVVGRKFS